MDGGDVLKINMLGGFTVTMDGKRVFIGKNAGAKFLRFLQLLAISGPAGSPREEIVENVFAGDALANVSNSFNNLVYQTRKQLQASNLPIPLSIRKENERYYLDSPCPILLDAEEFRTAAVNALAAAEQQDPDAAIRLRAALTLYTGDLLPDVSDAASLIRERDRYRSLFVRAVESLAGLLGEEGQSDALISLYESALRVTADEDGEISASLILALIAIGDTKSALKHYNKAVHHFQSQGKGRIPDRLEACASRLSETAELNGTFDLREELLDVVNTDAVESADETDGAFYCNYPSFIDTVKLYRRNLSRDERPVTLMLMTLADYEGKPIRMEKKREAFAGDLSAAIHESLRVGDIYTRHDESGFLVLLPAADEQNAIAISERIGRKLKEKAGSGATLRYRMLALSDLQ